MASRDTAIRALCKSLGKDYKVCTIDLERVIYRDFGNGFNVEISGVHTTSTKKKATLYLWFGDVPPECIIVKTVRNVAKENISEEVETLLAYSNELLSAGLDSRDKIFRHKFRITNCAKGGNGMMRKIFYGSEPAFTNADRHCFSRGNYECKVLLQNAKGQPVAVSQNKDNEFPVWKVEHGCSCVVFATYDEAMAYCKRRFLNLDGKAV
jgi:hypothetical protein